MIGLTLAGVLAVGAVVSWLAAQSTIVVAPVIDGEPEMMLPIYRAPLVVLSLLLATAAGVLAVLSVARLRRRSGAQARRER